MSGEVINTDQFPLGQKVFRNTSKDTLAEDGVLVLQNFLCPEALKTLQLESENSRDLAYFCTQHHTVYLSPRAEDMPPDHPRNRLVDSSKGCITDDQVPAQSPLRTLYNDPSFKDFLCTILGETALFPYADPLSSINLNYADAGQELGWHFDNSSFAITLMIQEPERGGSFEYITAMRDADGGEMNYSGVEEVLAGNRDAKQLNMTAGDLVLFRGRNAIHRVTPVEGKRTRVLAVLAYNSEPGISLSESARMTFFGRLN